MFGCVKRARMFPSRRNRSSPARPMRATFSSLTATRPSNRPSQRSASQTLPMPPWPMSDSSRYAPRTCPDSDGGAGRSVDLDNAVEKPRVLDRLVLGEEHPQLGGHLGRPGVESGQPIRQLLRVDLQRFVQIRTQRSPEVGIERSHAVAL